MFPVAYATGRTVSSAGQAGGLKGYAPCLTRTKKRSSFDAGGWAVQWRDTARAVVERSTNANEGMHASGGGDGREARVGPVEAHAEEARGESGRVHASTDWPQRRRATREGGRALTRMGAASRSYDRAEGGEGISSWERCVMPAYFRAGIPLRRPGDGRFPSRSRAERRETAGRRRRRGGQGDQTLQPPESGEGDR